ncbi:MAG: TatD family hydrolase [Thermoguttaceae bacterium]
MIDTHAHLDDEQFGPDLPEVLRRASEAGIAGIVCPGTDADSSEAVVQMARRYGMVHAAVGIQPNCCAEAGPGDWDRIVALAEAGGAVALGETGLDRYWDFAPLELQRDYFDRHLQMAQRRDLPVIIHCREAEAETLEMLRHAVARGPLRGVIHAFSGNADFAATCLDLGMHLSFAGSVTYRNKKFEALREAARTIPPDRILLETDSPYLVPHPLRGKEPRNEPSFMAHTASGLAELRGVPVEELAGQAAANARAFFGLA